MIWINFGLVAFDFNKVLISNQKYILIILIFFGTNLIIISTRICLLINEGGFI